MPDAYDRLMAQHQRKLMNRRSVEEEVPSGPHQPPFCSVLAHKRLSERVKGLEQLRSQFHSLYRRLAVLEGVFIRSGELQQDKVGEAKKGDV